MLVTYQCLDFLTRLQQCNSYQESWNAFLQVIDSLGFDTGMYIMCFHGQTPFHSPSLYVSNYNNKFLEEYDCLNSSNDGVIDTAVQWCYENDNYLEWESEQHRSLQSIKSKVIDELSLDYNMKYGISIPIHNESQLYSVGIGVCAVGASERDYKGNIQRNIPLLMQLSNIFHAYIKECHYSELFSMDIKTGLQLLNKNESETLKWLASGLTISEISNEKLFRSVESINLYIKSAKKKLKVKTRDQLIARAVILKII